MQAERKLDNVASVGSYFTFLGRSFGPERCEMCGFIWRRKTVTVRGRDSSGPISNLSCVFFSIGRNPALPVWMI